MSVWLTSVVRVLDMPPALKSVLREYCDFANDDFLGWPGSDSLAATTSYVERTVQLHMRTLEEDGILVALEGQYTYRGQLIKTVPHRVDLDAAIRIYGINPRLKLPDHWRAGARSIDGLAISEERKRAADNRDLLVPYVTGFKSGLKRPARKLRPERHGAPDSAGGESGAGWRRISCTQTIKNLNKPFSADGTAADGRASSSDVTGERRSPARGGSDLSDDARGSMWRDVGVPDTPAKAAVSRANTRAWGKDDCSARERACAIWRAGEARVRQAFGEAFWKAWWAPLTPHSDDGGTLTLLAPTRFAADHLRSTRLVDLGRLEKLLKRRVLVTHGSASRVLRNPAEVPASAPETAASR